MKNTLRIALLALFVSITSLAFAQQNGEVDLDQLVAAVQENPENAASLVEEAVRNSYGQLLEITERLLATRPDLAEEIVFGAIAGMPEPLSEDDLEQFLIHVVNFRPALAPDVVIGARRATSPGLEPVITASVRTALQQIISQRGLGVIGRTSQPSAPEPTFDPTYQPFNNDLIEVISPSQNP